MVVGNLNENHPKVIEFMILRRREGWQYQQDVFKPDKLQQTEIIGSYTSWDRVRFRKLPIKSVQRAEALRESTFCPKTITIGSSSTGKQGTCRSVYDLHVQGSNHEDKTAITAT